MPIKKFEKVFCLNEQYHTFRLIQGDITEQTTDAIVNAANSDLILGAGVAGAIRLKGGPQIQEECNILGGTPVGTAKITTGGNLKAPFVIHAVGPVFSSYTQEEAIFLLQNAVQSSLKLLEIKSLHSITFPAISTGIYGFPKDLAAKTIIKAVMDYFPLASASLLVNICLYTIKDYEIFYKVAKEII